MFSPQILSKNRKILPWTGLQATVALSLPRAEHAYLISVYPIQHFVRKAGFMLLGLAASWAALPYTAPLDLLT